MTCCEDMRTALRLGYLVEDKGVASFYIFDNDEKYASGTVVLNNCPWCCKHLSDRTPLIANRDVVY